MECEGYPEVRGGTKYQELNEIQPFRKFRVVWRQKRTKEGIMRDTAVVLDLWSRKKHHGKKRHVTVSGKLGLGGRR